MRKFCIAGNWKMNLLKEESIKLANDLKKLDFNPSNTEVILFPPMLNASLVANEVSDSNIKVGVQNMSNEMSGAFTGETSPLMVLDHKMTHTLVGHSERREYFNETDKDLFFKIQTALKNKIIPIFCLGETLDQREDGSFKEVLNAQLTNALKGQEIVSDEQLIVAYEPVWAIGTGKTASPEQAEEVHEFLRRCISEIFSEDFSSKVRILYGGSVKPQSALELLSMPNIDGALVGGASLDATQFGGIINAIPLK